MAIMACAECGGDISSQARSCPHCGFRYPRSTLEVAGYLIGYGIAAAIVIIIAAQVLFALS